eukprot:2380093-Prorocentrum_lima.AAC.1
MSGNIWNGLSNTPCRCTCAVCPQSNKVATHHWLASPGRGWQPGSSLSSLRCIHKRRDAQR